MFTVWETNLHKADPTPSYLHTCMVVCSVSRAAISKILLEVRGLKLLTRIKSFNSNVIT